MNFEIGYDPVNKLDVNLDDWLKQDKDNFVIFVKKNIYGVKHSVFCLKKSYFFKHHINFFEPLGKFLKNPIYKFCYKIKDSLITDKTWDSPDFLNISYHLGINLVINFDTFKKLILQSSHNIFSLEKGSIEKAIPSRLFLHYKPGEEVIFPHKNGELKGTIPKDIKKKTHINLVLKNPLFILKNDLELSELDLKPVANKIDLISYKDFITSFPNVKTFLREKEPTNIDEFPGYFIKILNRSDGNYYRVMVKDEEAFKKYFRNLEKIYGYLIDDSLQINIPYNEQVYFEEEISEALKTYSNPQKWDTAINSYLFYGEDYFKGNKFQLLYSTFWLNDHENKEFNNFMADFNLIGNSLESDNRKDIENYLKKKNIPFTPNQDINTLKGLILSPYKTFITKLTKKYKQKVIYLDNKIEECFKFYAPRLTIKKSQIKYYRGMNNLYTGLKKKGDKIQIKSYTSLSKSKKTAKSFGIYRNYYPIFPTNPNNPFHKGCCLYEFSLPAGLPYINMINTTQFKGEKEILLPKGITAKLVKITTVDEDPTQIDNVQAIQLDGTIKKFKIKYDIYHIEIEEGSWTKETTGDEESWDKELSKEYQINEKCWPINIGKLKVKKDLSYSGEYHNSDSTKIIRDESASTESESSTLELESLESEISKSYKTKIIKKKPKSGATSKKQNQSLGNICKGLNEEECLKNKKYCLYAKGAKRQYCRKKPGF